MSEPKPDTRKLTLKKTERLKSRSTIQTLFQLNQHLKLYPFKLVYYTGKNTKSEVQFGVTVSKRNFKTAVMRNRIKRQMREGYRTNKYILLDKIKDLNLTVPIMLIYVAPEPLSSKEINKKIIQLLHRLGDKIIKDQT